MSDEMDGRWELIERQLGTATLHDSNAEEAVLGAIMLSDAVVPRLLDVGLEGADFYYSRHRALYEAAVALQREGSGIDEVTLTDELRRVGVLDDIGGPAAVQMLSGSVPDAGNVVDYARVVRRMAFLRRRRDAAWLVLEDIGNEERWAEFVQAAESPFDADGHDRRKLDLRDVMAAADIELPWRCGELAADGHVTVLAGRGGEGKSLLMLALAGAVQRGVELAGIDCKPGRVVIFDAENAPYVIGSRLRSAGIPIDRLEVYDSEGLDLVRHRSWFRARAEGAQLVVFDSVRTLAPGAKENDSDDMAPIMAALKHVARTTGAAVVAIHHRGKGEADFRGSSAIRDQTDMMFALDRDSRDPMAASRRSLRCIKCRIAQEPPTRWFTIKHHADTISLFEAAPFEPEEHPRPVRAELEEQIAGIVADKGPIARGEVARELGRDPKDQSVRRAVQELVETGIVLKVQGHRYVAAGTEGVTAPLTPPDTLDTLSAAGGVSSLKGNDTLTPPAGEGE